MPFPYSPFNDEPETGLLPNPYREDSIAPDYAHRQVDARREAIQHFALGLATIIALATIVQFLAIFGGPR